MKTLKKLELSNAEVLSNSEMKTLFGGVTTAAATTQAPTTTKAPFDVTKDVPLLQDPNFFNYQSENPITGSLLTYGAIGISYIGYLLR